MAQILADTPQYTVVINGTTFKVLTFHAHEEMSHLSRYSLTLRCDDPEIEIKSLVRLLAEIHLEWGGKIKRWYGMIASISQVNAGLPTITNEEGEYGEYAVEVVPHFWMLTQKTNCKIFQWIGTPDILRMVLDARGMAGKYKIKLTQSYAPREFCLQYRETDFAFLSRLMEEEGMFYYFYHDPDDPLDLLVISDDASGYDDCYPDDTVVFKKATGILSTSDEYLSSLTYEESAYTGQVAYRDFNYREPKKPPDKLIQNAPDNPDYAVYDYHLERYLDDGRGIFLAKMAVQAQAAMRKTLSASGNFRSIGAGMIFTLQDAYRSDLNISWVVVSASFSASQQEGGVDYAVSFTAIPADHTFRPLPRTPRPSLNLQTAYVVGPPGVPIYMDDYGRAKVHFHWDLVYPYDDTASCWIRVAQPYAGMDQNTGDKHGFQWHPLVGDEVVVDFFEGDPDKPIIVGSVYNFQNLPLVKPEQLIRSEIRSPYQHLLAFDDKYQYIQVNTPYPHTLRMDDPGKYTKLSTQYNNALTLQDPHKNYDEIPFVTLETGGAETIKMQDGAPSYGNNIKVSTADGHYLQFAEGPAAQGITASSRKSNKVVLDDQNKNITIQTTDGHRVLMDDANKTILVTSKDKHRIEINDQEKYIAVADESGKHRLTIDIANEQITLATDTGSIAILAPEGQLQIEADSISIKSKTSISIECDNMSTKAESKIEVQAPSVSTCGSTIVE